MNNFIIKKHITLDELNKKESGLKITNAQIRYFTRNNLSYSLDWTRTKAGIVIKKNQLIKYGDRDAKNRKHIPSLTYLVNIS